MTLHLKNTIPPTCLHDIAGSLMLSSVGYIKGCETCIRQAFEEALQEALKSVPKTRVVCGLWPHGMEALNV